MPILVINCNLDDQFNMFNFFSIFITIYLKLARPY